MKAVFSTGQQLGPVKGPYDSIYVEGYSVVGVKNKLSGKIATYNGQGLFDVGNGVIYEKMSVEND